MDHDAKYGVLPMGFGMALMQNPEARAHYQQLPVDRQMELINKTHTIRSKKEMQHFVAEITKL